MQKGLMMDHANQGTSDLPNQRTRRERRGEIFLFIISAIAILSFSALNLLLTWSLEQSLFENPQGIPDIRWVIQLATSLLLIVPLGLFYRYNRSANLKPFFGLWLWGAIVASIGDTHTIVTCYRAADDSPWANRRPCACLWSLQVVCLEENILLWSIQGWEARTRGWSAMVIAADGASVGAFGALGSWADALRCRTFRSSCLEHASLIGAMYFF